MNIGESIKQRKVTYNTTKTVSKGNNKKTF